MTNNDHKISATDKDFFERIRVNVAKLIEDSAKVEDGVGIRVLDIAPQDYEGAKRYYTAATVETLDIDPAANATFTVDLCENNRVSIPDETFDVIICTEVLEHVNNPFDAAKEMFRILKKGGRIYVSTPYNFRIHGPLPDNWRFTEHGLRILFSDFSVVDVVSLEDNHRFLMPVHYTTRVIK
ncbi:MAG TPA: methyltransferase domain-containing protein [Candidatus Saccharimonadales bacterium]